MANKITPALTKIYLKRTKTNTTRRCIMQSIPKIKSKPKLEVVSKLNLKKLFEIISKTTPVKEAETAKNKLQK